MDLTVLFSNLVGLFLLIGVGFFAVRAKLLPVEISKPLSIKFCVQRYNTNIGIAEAIHAAIRSGQSCS